MKHGKKPTVAQRKLIAQQGLDWHDWLVERDDHKRMVIIHRTAGSRITIPKN